MTWARPAYLGLIIVLPIVLAGFVLLYARRRRRVHELLGQHELLARLGPDLARFPVARLVLVTLAGLALGVAAAGPQWGTEVVETRARATNIVLALDVSRSMLVRDAQPNRLERARLLARMMLRELGGDRFGLVAFAGRSYVLSPLTTDHSALELFVDAADPDIVSQGGSSLAAAITQATDLARGDGQTGGDRAVIVVTDGEALEEEDDVIAAADRASSLGVPVYAVGVGSTGGGPVPDQDPASGRVIGYKRDLDGEIVISRLNEALLRDVARRTRGEYVQLDQPGATSHLISRLNSMNRSSLTSGRKTQAREQFIWFVAAALALLALDALLARRAATPRADAPVEPTAVRPEEVAA